jgi:fructose-specific phosphotransferase system IIC component
MNLPALVTHGICALSVWSDAIVARLFLLVGGMVALALALLAGVVAMWLSRAAVVPGWIAPAAAAVLGVLLAGVVCLLLAVFVLGSRTAANVLPHRDWRDHVLPGPTRAHGRDR